jgi:hypothetical protein
VLSARRRLLGMLLMLVIGSGTLAFTELAAWWVIVPPSVMLLGYMALLREAAKADAERREVARTQAARPAAVAAPPAAPPVPATPPAPAPSAEVIEISASLAPAGEEFYDQYADAKLRAVGDLAGALTGSRGSRVPSVGSRSGALKGCPTGLVNLISPAIRFPVRDERIYRGGFRLRGGSGQLWGTKCSA